MSEGTEAQWGFILCLRSQFTHENLNPDLSASFFILYPISMISNQLWKCLGLFPSKCSPTPDGHLSSYLPMTTTTYFSDAWTIWSSLSPSPRDWLSSGSTESNVSSPGFPGKKKKKIQVAPRGNFISLSPSRHYSLPQRHQIPFQCISFPGSYLSLADLVACSKSLVVLKHILHEHLWQQKQQFIKYFLNSSYHVAPLQLSDMLSTTP